MKDNNEDDFLLIREAIGGSRVSLENLIKKHQNDIYNIALKMVYYPDDAYDITQEVLIKIITGLSSFRFESSFRTWAYIITVNTILNVKKMNSERRLHTEFSEYGKSIDNTPDMLIDSSSPEMNLLIEEVRLMCLQAMLICLDRKQRMAFILGSIFIFPDYVCAEIMDTSKDNFRQMLSRARKDIRNFMENRCGLIHKSNPCLCSKKTKAMIESGAVNPDKLTFNRNYVHSIETKVKEKAESLNEFFSDESETLFRKMPYNEMPDFSEKIKIMIESNDFKNIFNFN
ncbi:MAG: RNA polymerase sigma factor [Bacteroidetes bacterium]|nr:RNA polymerase sigma factor [Bacteroidota bacterium]